MPTKVLGTVLNSWADIVKEKLFKILMKIGEVLIKIYIIIKSS